MRKYFTLVALSFALCLQSCGGRNGVAQVPAPPVTQSTVSDSGSATDHADAADDREAIAAQDAHMIKAEITFRAPVKKLLRDDTKGLPHQKFLLELSNGTTVLCAHDIKYAPRVPLETGDQPTIHGEYIWNRKGGLIHWTHHSDSPRHEGGWIKMDGIVYE